VVAKALTDNNPFVRRKAKRFLRSHEDNAQTVDLLITRLGDPDHWVVIDTLMSLAQLKDPRAIKALLALEAKNPHQNTERQDAIKRITGKPFKKVLAEYRDEIKNFQIPPAPIDEGDPRPLNEQLRQGDQFSRLTALHNAYGNVYPKITGALLKGIRGDDPLIKYHFISDSSVYLNYWLRADEKNETIYKRLCLLTRLSDWSITQQIQVVRR